MIKFILSVILIAILLKIAQKNAYISFGIYLFTAICFFVYTINIVDTEEVVIKKKRFYNIVNSK